MNRFDCQRLRRTVLQMAYAGSSVHIACAFSIIEILAVLYRWHLRLGTQGPRSPDRDYLVLSKGHGVLAQYACLRELGWIGEHEVASYFANGSRLKGLSDAHVPGLEVTSGSLGHGLSVGVGLALAAQRRGTGQRCFAIVGDGEMNESAMREALLFAAHAQLSNLIVIVDQNGHQAMGRTDEVMRLGSLTAKFDAFGFDVAEVNGHDEPSIDAAIRDLLKTSDKRPKALIARTIKGKGVAIMEDDNRWHYTRLTKETFEASIRELTPVA